MERTADRGVDQPGKPDQSTDQPAGIGPLRLGSLNLHCLFESPDTRAQGIANELKVHNLDSLAVQEVCETIATPSDNMANRLLAAAKAATGVDWELKWTVTHQSWSSKYNEGIGILAKKGSILAFGEQALYKAPDDFARKVIWAKVSTPRGVYYHYSTHLTISSDWNNRLKQAQDVMKVVNTHLADNLPQVVCGDFNDKDWSGPVQAITNGPPAMTDAMKSVYPTSTPGSIGCPNPGDRIDFIMIRSGALKSISKVEQLAKQYQGICLSDHVGLWSEFYQK